MTVPEDFKLEPLSAGTVPAAQPPAILKRDIYKDVRVFQEIDSHAIAEARCKYDNFCDLMWNLIFKNNFTELEKARAIFRWLTCKDLMTINLKSDQNQATTTTALPERVLNDFKNGKGSYARAFEFLARYSGLHAVSIKGWAKGVDYRVGSCVTSDNVNHSWNAVNIDGNWHLVDCNWAANRVNQPKENTNIDDYDDFFFLSEPHQMIFSHFPEDTSWQLLPKPISTSDFEKLSHVKSHFFTLGLETLTQTENTFFATEDGGILTLTVGYTKPVAFTYKLTYGDDKVEYLNGVSLNKYVLQEMTNDGRVTYYMRAPSAGEYQLTMFARDAAEGVPKGSIIFRSVAEYKIICMAPVQQAFGPFPYCSDSSWGSDVYVHQYPIIPSIKTAILVCVKGKMELHFQKDPRIQLYARLVREELSFEDLKSCLLLEEIKKDHVMLRVDLKKEGEYGLEIFANDETIDGEIFSHFSQYLMIWSAEKDFSDIYGFTFDRTDLPEKNWAKDYCIYSGQESNVQHNKDILDEENQSRKDEKMESPAGKDEEADKEMIYSSIISMEPPNSFEAAPLSERDSAAVKKPSASYKHKKLFSDVIIFKNVDGHSNEVSKVQHGNFRDLIWHLIYARNITDELEKARAIFVYLSSMDLNKINFNKDQRDSPEEMLMNLKDGRTTYARVYETLCSYAGLHCQTVSGFAKGADYRPGMHFSNEDGQHSWNAVYVNSSWQLIDCHWAARRLVGKQTMGDRVRYELDEFYFMPEPNQLIFTHLPHDATWQLLEEPISIEEFENLVSIKSAFFKYGLKIVSHREAVIHTNEEVTIIIGCPLAKADKISFTFSLQLDEYGEEFHGIQLNQFGMNYTSNENSYFKIRFPESGYYQLVIYAKERSGGRESKEGGPEMFGGVCEYEIVCEKGQKHPLSFPPCSHTTWGQGDSFHNYNLIPLEKRAIIGIEDGAVDVCFKMGDELRFTGKLKSSMADESELVPFLLQRSVHDVTIFKVIAPHAGEFGLEIYANNPLTDGQALHHVYQYLIISNEVAKLEPFPSLPMGYLGPQPLFKPLGLSVAAGGDPYLEMDSGELQLSFNMTQHVRMSCQLLFCSQQHDGEDEDFSEYTLQQSVQNSIITFIVKLPQPGFYKVQFYAIAAAETSESLPGVYNYLIKCSDTFASSLPFPKQYGIWKDGCYLYEPLDGHLQPNRTSKGGASTYQHIFFHVDVPNATALAVVVGEDWFQLEEDQQGATTTWKGEVLMENFWGKERKLSLCASFDKPPSRFGTLLEYSM